MKTRIGIMIAALGVSACLWLPLLNAQEFAPEPARPARAQAQVQKSVPSVPAVASGPVQQNVPAVPAVPAIPAVDPLGDVMFPPDLIMRHARELELTGEQKTFMRGEIQQATLRFNELQWQLQEEMESLHQTMKPNAVNDEQALSQLDKVLGVEREIKRLHIGMGIRLKNKLTPAQQEKLQTIRMAMRPAMPG